MGTKKALEKTERVRLFIQLLKELDKRFDNAESAYQHLLACLEEIEQTHAPGSPNRMSIIPFDGFYHHPTYNLFYRETNKQTILLHPKGGYGIYRNDPLRYMDFEFYRGETTCLIRMPSLHGVSLWSP